MPELILPGMVTRRTLLQAAATTGAVLAAAPLATPAVWAASPTLKIGYVTPATGPLAGFAEADDFNIALFRTLLKNGLKVGGKTYAIEIVVKDSQSNPNRAAQVAKGLIVQDKVNIMLVGGTPETCVPVSTQCEIEEVPCISANCPWQAWFFGRQSNPANPQPFNYTYHFFWGLEDIIAAYSNMWGQLSTNKQVGALFPNDVDGNAWGDPKVGLPPALGTKGYKFVDPGRYQDLNDDFTAQITAFKQGGTEIVTGVMLPPDFTTFWNQARQQGFRPKIASIGKAILFPVSVQSLGKSGHNLSSEVWWGPDHPFKSSLNGMSCKQLSDEFVAASGKQWTPPIGGTHAMLEGVIESLKRSEDPTNPEATAKSMAALDFQTIIGRIKFGQENVPPFARKNVCRTSIAGGQWRLDADGKFSLVTVDNQTAPEVPLGGKMEPLA